MAQSRLASQKRDVSHLPSSADGLLLHSGGRNRRRRAGHRDASEGVDDWNGVASAGRRRLVKLQ